MRKISSRKTFFYKKVFPVIWFGGLAVATGAVLALPTKHGQHLPPIALLAPAVVAIFGFILMRKLISDLMDEVYEDGDHLIVRKKGREEIIPLSNIINVSHSIAVNPPRVTLTLRTPCSFGKKVAFCPKVKWSDVKSFGFSVAVADDLITRVDAARGNPAPIN